MHLLFYTLFLVFATVASAFPYGAGTCNSDQMIIEGVAKSPMGKLNDKLGYDFKVYMKNNEYIPKGPPVVLEITGDKKFRGLLLYASASDKSHVGEWCPPHGFKIKPNCTGDPKGTLTHRNPSKKRTGTKFLWKPPQTDVGPLTFIGTVVMNTQEGFQIVKTQQTFTAVGSNATQPNDPPKNDPPKDDKNDPPKNDPPKDDKNDPPKDDPKNDPPKDDKNEPTPTKDPKDEPKSTDEPKNKPKSTDEPKNKPKNPKSTNDPKKNDPKSPTEQNDPESATDPNDPESTTDPNDPESTTEQDNEPSIIAENPSNTAAAFNSNSDPTAAASTSSGAPTMVKFLWVQSCLIAPLTIWYLFSAKF